MSCAVEHNTAMLCGSVLHKEGSKESLRQKLYIVLL